MRLPVIVTVATCPLAVFQEMFAPSVKTTVGEYPVPVKVVYQVIGTKTKLPVVSPVMVKEVPTVLPVAIVLIKSPSVVQRLQLQLHRLQY